MVKVQRIVCKSAGPHHDRLAQTWTDEGRLIGQQARKLEKCPRNLEQALAAEFAFLIQLLVYRLAQFVFEILYYNIIYYNYILILQNIYCNIIIYVCILYIREYII